MTDEVSKEYAEKLQRDMVENFEASRKEDDLKFINELHDLYFPHTPKMPENVFREVFLPWLLRELPEEQDEIYYENWYNVTGGPTIPVDVYDQKGTILFRVPPLMTIDDKEVSRKLRPSETYASIISQAIDTGRVHAQSGFQELMAGFGYRLGRLLKPVDREAWKPVIDYYAHGIISGTGENKKDESKAATPPEQSAGDDLDFSFE